MAPLKSLVFSKTSISEELRVWERLTEVVGSWEVAMEGRLLLLSDGLTVTTSSVDGLGGIGGGATWSVVMVAKAMTSSVM